MEASISAEDNHGGRDSGVPRNYKGSAVKIDSICIDLSRANNETANKAKGCEHFSIREYAGEVRKRDKKICWPFSIDDNADELPPLHVAKFRWWRCQNCLQEIGVKGDPKDNDLLPNCCDNGYKSNSICQQTLRLDAIEGRNGAVNTNLHSTEFNAPLCRSKKEDEVLKAPNLGHASSTKDDVNKKNPTPTFGATKANLCLIQKDLSSDHTAIKARSNGFLDFCTAGHENREFSGTLEGATSGSGEIFHKKKHIFNVDQQGEVRTLCGTSKATCLVEESVFDAEDHRGIHIPMEINVHDVTGPETENDSFTVPDGLCNMHSKRTPKVRLLTELMRADEVANIDNFKTRIPPGSVASTGLGQNNKRKVSQDDDWRTQQASCPKDMRKKVRFFGGEPKSGQISLVAGSESEESIPARISISTGKKSQSTKHMMEKSSNLCKKKSKKSQHGDRSSSLVPSENLPANDDDKTRDALFISPRGVLDGREINPSFGSYFPTPCPRIKPKLCKKKNAPQIVKDKPVSLMPPSDGLLDKSKKRGPEIVSFQPGAKESSHNVKDPRLSLQDCLAESHLSQFEEQQHSISREQQPMAKPISHKSIADSNVTSTSAPDTCFGRQDSGDLGILNPTNGMPFLRGNGRQNFNSQAKCGPFPVMQQKNFFDTYNNGKGELVGVHGQFGNTKRDKMDEKVLEQEIVELLAKNQYERHHHDTRDNFNLLQTTANTVNNPNIIDFSREHKNRHLRLVPGENHQVRNQSVKQKSVTFFPGNIKNPSNTGLLEEAPASTVISPVSQCKETQSGGFQRYATAGSSRDSLQDCRFHEDGIGLRFSHGTPQASEAYKCQSVSKKYDEPGSVWSSLMANNIRFGLTNPHESPTHPINRVHDLGIINMNGPNTKKQNRNFSLEAFNQAHAEYQLPCKQKGYEHHPKMMGSLDYSNETIPAMHLLSLVHAGVQSHVAFNIEKNQDILRKSSFARDRYSNDFLALGSGVRKVSNNSSYQSPEPCAKSRPSEKSCECSTAAPTVCPSPNSIQNNRNFQGGIGLTARIALESSGVRKVSNNSSYQSSELCAKSRPRDKSRECSTAAPTVFPSPNSIQNNRNFQGGIGLTARIALESSGVRKVSNNSSYQSFEPCAKSRPQDKSCECSTAAPTLCPSPNSIQNNKNFQGGIDLTARIAFEASLERKTNPYVARKRGRPKKVPSTSHGLNPNHKKDPALYMQKRISRGAAESVGFPFQCHAGDGLKKWANLQSSSDSGTVWPRENVSETATCSINRNPADFSIPEAGNKYTIGAEDIKFQKSSRADYRSGVFIFDWPEQQQIKRSLQ